MVPGIIHPADNDFPPEPNTYGPRSMPGGQEVCYDFALHRTIDEEYCDDIGEDTGSDLHLIDEFGFPYCPPRVMCVDDDSASGLVNQEPPATIDNKSIIVIENKEELAKEATEEEVIKEEEELTTSAGSGSCRTRGRRGVEE